MENCLENIPAAGREFFSDSVGKIVKLPGVAKVMLFGSMAKGTQTNDSDIDVAVFVDADKTFFLDEYRVITKICATPLVDIQTQVFSAKELEAPCGIVEEIVNYGVSLFP